MAAVAPFLLCHLPGCLFLPLLTHSWLALGLCTVPEGSGRPDILLQKNVATKFGGVARCWEPWEGPLRKGLATGRKPIRNMFAAVQLRQALQGVSPGRVLTRLSHASAQLLSSEAPLPTDVYVQVCSAEFGSRQQHQHWVSHAPGSRQMA